jgi:hypothetical protein
MSEGKRHQSVTVVFLSVLGDMTGGASIYQGAHRQRYGRIQSGTVSPFVPQMPVPPCFF